jgi:hypothetical protein
MNFRRREAGQDAGGADHAGDVAALQSQGCEHRPGAVSITVLRRHLPFGPKAFLVLLALSNESR